MPAQVFMHRKFQLSTTYRTVAETGPFFDTSKGAYVRAACLADLFTI